MWLRSQSKSNFDQYPVKLGPIDSEIVCAGAYYKYMLAG